MRSLSAYFYPASYSSQEPDAQRRTRLAVNICLFFVGLMVVYEPVYIIFLGSSGAGRVLGPGVALFVAFLFVHRSGAVSFSLFANTLIAGSVIVQTLNICTTGGPSSILIAGYIDILIMAALLVGRRATYIWTALIILAPLILGLLELNGLRLPHARFGAGSETVQLFITISVIAGAAIFVLLLKAGLDSTLHLLHKRNGELIIAHDNTLRAEKLAADMEQKHRIDVLRNRIARDLHDDIGSTLSEINIYSSVAGARGIDSSVLLRKISESSSVLMEAMSDIVWSINPGNDNLQTLELRMREYAVSVFEAKGIALTMGIDPGLSASALPELVRKDFYLIFKEAVNNVCKHAGARRVSISLRASAADLRLSICDDGAGFDHTVGSGPGNGLRNMESRAAAIGGELSITSQHGSGTEVELRMRGEKKSL